MSSRQGRKRGGRALGAAVAGAAFAALVLALSACGGRSQAQTLSRPAHVFVIVMENREYGQVIGSPAAPYINSLARRGALATNYHAVAHPSLPNYLALTGGSTFGYRGSDCMTCHVSATNLVDQLQTAGISWKAYMEGLPYTCSFKPSAGNYVRRHDPFLYYDDVAHNRSRCRYVVPASRLTSDLAHHTLPRFAWLSPDLCHDMHNCGTYTGDKYLRSLIPQVLKALGSNGVLFLTWDEGQTSSGCCSVANGGHIVLIAAGPGARSGVQSSLPYDHYSLLRTIEDLWGLPHLREAGCPCTRALTALLR